MPAVNQFNGFGGTSGFNNWPNLNQPYTAAPSKPLYDPSRPNGDCLKQVLYFQKDNGLAQDGEVGPKTWKAVYENVF